MNINKVFLYNILCLLAISCSDEDSRPLVQVSQDADIQITIYTPANTLPKSTVRSSEVSESKIEKIKVVVLQQVGGVFEYQYMVDGEQISSVASNTVTFTAKLVSSDSPLKLILLANYKDVFGNYNPNIGASETDVRKNIIYNFDGDLGEEIPMYGEVTISSLNAEEGKNISLKMLRSVARVDINNNVGENISENFVMEKAYVFRANDKINLIPGEGNVNTGENVLVTKATVPDGSNFMADEDNYSKSAESNSINISQLYVPEALPVLDESAQLHNATCIVVGGYYANDDKLSYYRIDFNSGVAGHPFGQVLRNHKYIFSVESVHSRGWATPEDAANNKSSAISITTQVWNEMTSEMYFSNDDNYLGISSRNVILNYNKGAEQIVKLQTSVPFQIQAVNGQGEPIGSIIDSDGQSFNTDFYNLKIKQESSNGTNVYSLIITSLAENKTNASFTGNFKVFTDAWTFVVNVEQLSYYEMFNNKLVHVLTVTSLPGDLGFANGTYTDGVSGISMRRVLENTANFSPGGRIPVGGIIVHDILNNTISLEDAASMYKLEKMLEIADVVHLPRNCSPSRKASKMIYDWIMESDYRVLILGTDNAATNAYLQDDFDTNDLDGYWQELTNVAGLYTDPYGDNAEPFFNGKFGKVPLDSEMGYIDQTCGYSDGYNWQTTIPLLRITENSPDGATYMTHGINKEVGIFYCGDSRITTSAGSAMSQSALDSGTVSSDFDKLMANIWAWIVERVVTGNK